VNGCSVGVSVPAFDHGAEGGRRREIGRAFDDGSGEELVPPIGSAFVDGAECVCFGLGLAHCVWVFKYIYASVSGCEKQWFRV
jgi:hypothetical protein